jgi:hypothetical protein
MLLDAVKKSAAETMSDILTFIKHQKSNTRPNIETSSRCTLRCPQCTRIKLYSPKNTSNYRETKQRIDNGFDLTITDAEKLLKFFDSGLMLCGSISDPIHWPYLLDFLALANNYPNKSIQIHTAANQKNLDWYKHAFSLSHKNIVWRFGLDGMADTSPVYRVGQDSQLLFDAMILGKSMGLTIEWQFIIFKHNQHQIDEAKEFAQKYKINLFFVKSNRSGGGVEVPDEYKPKRNKETIDASKETRI